MEDAEAAMMRVLYDEHAAALWRYVVRLTGDSTWAEDVVQETLLRAWRHPEVSCDADRSARAWLFTVARNLIIDDRRSARFRREVDVAEVADAAPSPGDRAGVDDVESALDRLMVGTAMGELSEAHRSVITRAYYQGHSIAQIARDLQLAEGTVKSRLHYAVRALRLHLQEMGVTR